jgi:hypothetical protein
MARKQLSREQKIRVREKPLDVTLAELKAEIDAADGDLRRSVPLKRFSGSLRLMIRCRHDIPRSWGMSLILDNAMIDCVHYHRTDYTNTEGIRTAGWHRDLMESGKNVGRKTLDAFNPQSVDEFILRVLKIFKITLKEGNADAGGQLSIN